MTPTPRWNPIGVSFCPKVYGGLPKGKLYKKEVDFSYNSTRCFMKQKMI